MDNPKPKAQRTCVGHGREDRIQPDAENHGPDDSPQYEPTATEPADTL